MPGSDVEASRTRLALPELAAQIGRELACSDWFAVEQARIEAFADATGDRQWIHLDAERCARESPFRVPVAHGYLTLALLPHLMDSCLQIDGVAMAVNYGLDRVRFPAPLPAAARIRVRVVLEAIEPVTGGALQARWLASVETDAGAKPVCIAQLLARYFPVA